jgi:hypothetical protein
MVLAAYPELLARQISIHIQPVGGMLVVRVTDGPASGKPSAAVPALVSAVASFDSSGRLERYSATGVLLEDARNQALREHLAAHPSWKESDAELYLQQLIGRSAAEALGPLAAVTARGRAVLGGSVALHGAPRLHWKRGAMERPGSERVVRPVFQPPPAPPGVPRPPASAATPLWIVDASSTDASGAPVQYRLEYEPISGRLVGAVRQ